MSDDYLRINLANWNSRVPHHEIGYDLEAHIDPAHLSQVVTFDLPLLGDVGGLDAVHLQCHIGTDTVSLAKLGARMTGLDFSEPALEVARRLAADCGHDIDYVCSDVYGAVETLGRERFDLVYTGIGALCWLPDVRRWAQVVAQLLRPGGRLFIREGHPMLWSLCDPRPDQMLVVEYPYFEVDGGTTFRETTTYVDHEGELEAPDIVHFNHGLGEIFNALWDAGMEITGFVEHDSVPWNAFEDEMVADERGEYRLRDQPSRLAASYTLQARKR
jgi:SAM-dependent methyltransferase